MKRLPRVEFREAFNCRNLVHYAGSEQKFAYRDAFAITQRHFKATRQTPCVNNFRPPQFDCFVGC